MDLETARRSGREDVANVHPVQPTRADVPRRRAPTGNGDADQHAKLARRNGVSIRSAPDTGVYVETRTAHDAESTPPQSLSRRKRIPSLPSPQSDELTHQ